MEQARAHVRGDVQEVLKTASLRLAQGWALHALTQFCTPLRVALFHRHVGERLAFLPQRRARQDAFRRNDIGMEPPYEA